jgi:dCMP deaminase
MSKVLVVYVPVLHQGYINFFRSHQEAQRLYLLSEETIKDLSSYHKEIRALSSEELKKAIESLGVFKEVKILTPSDFEELKNQEIISPQESISQEFIQKYFPEKKVIFDKIFLRWDESNVKIEDGISFDRESNDPFDLEMIARAHHQSEQSSDWWRHVGAVVVKEKEVVIDGHNRHVPSEHQPYIDGDPRDVIPAGQDPHLSTALHAEQSVITEAAKKGISLEGTSLYLTNFPCTMCAKLVAHSGIKKVFYKKGSALLDGERILKARGVEIIHVKQKSR